MKMGKPQTIAKRLGQVLNPFALFTALFALVAAFTAASWQAAMLYMAMELIAAGSVVASLMHRTAAKTASDFWLKVREERKVPALVLLASATALQIALIVFGAPRELVFLMGSMLGTALVLALVTLVWKASAHSAVAAHAAVWGVAVLGVGGLAFVVTVPVVMWARVMQNRHTPAQVVAGAAAAATLSAIGVWSV